MMTSRKRFHLGTAGRRIPGAVVLLLTALAFMPVFVGSPCGNIHPPQRFGLAYANREPQWSADGQSIVVNLGYRIYRVSADGSSVARIPAEGEDGQMGPSLAPDGRIVYMDVTDYDPRLTTINGDGRKKHHSWRGVVVAIKVTSFPAWSPDGRYVAFSAGGKNDIDTDYWGSSASKATVMDAEGSLTASSQPPFPAAATKGRPVWSNDGQQVAFSWGCRLRCMVTVIDTDGTGKTVVDAAEIAEPGKPAHETEGTLSSVTWSTDDRTIYYVLKQGRHLPAILYSTNLPAMETRQISDLGDYPIYNLAISPDGSNLMFATDMSLIIIGANGADSREIINEQQLLQNGGYYFGDIQASWSPDGSRIAFTNTNWRSGIYPGHGVALVTTLFTIVPDGSDFRQLTSYDDAGNVVPANAELVQP